MIRFASSWAALALLATTGGAMAGPLKLVPAFGDPHAFTGALPKDFGVSVEYGYLDYVTREIAVSEHRSWTMTLSLGDEARVSGRLAWRIGARTSTSRYASRDGSDHADERRDDGEIPLHGTWSADGATLRIALERSSDAEGRMFMPSPVTLDCTALARADGTVLLACRASEGAPLSTLLRSPGADHGRRWIGLAEEDAPVIVLGGAPGISLELGDARGMASVNVRAAHPSITPQKAR